MNLNGIGTVEDACFEAIGKRKIYPHSKMTHDWTDFMVEHMSKWWKTLRAVEIPDSTMFNHTVKILKESWNPILHFKPNHSAEEQGVGPLHPTIAMIAFAPYKSKYQDRGHSLTAHSLAATIASLYNVGYGRIVVTGYWEDDHIYVNEAFRLLSHQANANSTNKVGNTELGYIRITDKTWTKTRWVERNISRGSVVGMQLALTGRLNSTHEQTVKLWLGTSHPRGYWKYVYLTEPDTILHTKIHLLELIKDGLDKGISFFSHRLQPLPRESDIPKNDNPQLGKTLEGLFVPGHVPPFSIITTLKVGDSCCDGGFHRPGRTEEFGTKQKSCGDHWWACGLRGKIKSSTEDILERHKRLAPYPMMRLDFGIQVIFASTTQGRRCFPSKTPCNKNHAPSY